MKTALVTGGLRGIGLGIVKKLLSEGYNVSVIGRADNESVKDRLDSIKDELLKGKDNKIFYYSGSIAHKKNLAEYVRATLEQFKSIEVLVNNAGIAPSVRADLLDMSEESFDEVISVNLKGNLMLTQLVAKEMIKQQTEGIIINISSISAYTASINRGEYCVSKAGVSMLTSLFADRLAPEGIYVYEIRPGIINTDMTSTVKEKYDTLIGSGLLPIKRWGEPDDIAEAVHLLCLGKLRYSTGEVLNVDGGFHMRRL